jgi:hypothetical protein
VYTEPGHEVEYPHVRLCVDIDKRRSISTRFVVQLERRVNGDWFEVVRFDENPIGHDTIEEGFDRAVYRDGEKARVKDDFPPVNLTQAPRYCVAYIEEHGGVLLRRFEQWHNLTPGESGRKNP